MLAMYVFRGGGVLGVFGLEFFGFVLIWGVLGFFFDTDIELHYCKTQIPSLLAFDGVMFGLHILKNAFMININWWELSSHAL